MRLLRNLTYKIKTTREIWFSGKSFRTLELAEDSHIRSTVRSILMDWLKPQSEQQVYSINDNVEKIVESVKRSPGLAPSQQLEELLQTGEILNQAFWFHSQLSGLTATWEFKVRFLGSKFGISPNTPANNKSKENRAKKSVQHISLADTIKELNKKSNHRLNLRFNELSGLRDSIIHCNPQAMKPYSQALFGKNGTKNLRGNVITISVGSGKIQNMSDVKHEAEIESLDLFGWFIEVFNSGLPKKAFDAFDESIRAIDTLITFSACCFDERKGIFKKLAIDGKALAEEDIVLFEQYFAKPFHSDPKDAREFLSKVSSCFKNLSPN